MNKAGAYATVAYLQAKAGQEKEALRWADALGHRLQRSQALMGLAAGLAERRGLNLDRLQAPADEVEKRPAARREEAARREWLMKTREKYDEMLKMSRDLLRKLAEPGENDRHTLALRQQHAMEHQHSLRYGFAAAEAAPAGKA